jgi:hypothetical protein
VDQTLVLVGVTSAIVDLDGARGGSGARHVRLQDELYHERSHDNQGLQAVDLFCWGIFRKYETGDAEWYDMYRDAIAFETEYLR